LAKYIRPKFNVCLGVISSLIAGLVAPFFGGVICKVMFTNMTTDYAIDMAREAGETYDKSVI